MVPLLITYIYAQSHRQTLSCVLNLAVISFLSANLLQASPTWVPLTQPFLIGLPWSTVPCEQGRWRAFLSLQTGGLLPAILTMLSVTGKELHFPDPLLLLPHMKLITVPLFPSLCQQHC